MTKKHIWFVVLSSIIIGGISGWLIMRFVMPELNTVGILRRYNLNPVSAPLVINTREEIRVNEGSDSVAAIKNVKPWMVSILAGSDLNNVRVLGSGLVLTSDGLIATTKGALGQSPVYYVSFTDGRVMAASEQAADPSSDLVLIKVEANNLATAVLGIPKDLQLGQRIIVLSSSLGQYQATDTVSYLSSELRNVRTDQIFSTERMNLTFGVDEITSAQEGSLAVSLDAQVQGLFSKNGVITAETIRSALNSYFANKKIVRNNIGLYYQNISKASSNLFNIPEGVIIKRPNPGTAAVVPLSPAQTAGLKEGDYITKVDNQQINFDNSFEELLQRKTPGASVPLTVLRNGQTLELNLLIGSR